MLYGQNQGKYDNTENAFIFKNIKIYGKLSSSVILEIKSDLV